MAIRRYHEEYALLAAGTATTKKSMTAASAAAGPEPLRILAEGDSWFKYPVVIKDGVIPRLSDLLKLPINFLNSLAEPGDEARSMLGVDQRKALSKALAAGTAGAPYDALLFSGGGNDIVGDPLCLWLRTFTGQTNAADLIDPVRFGSILATVRAAYEDLIALRDRMSRTTKLFLNSYDFAVPGLGGVCGRGPWLKPSLDLRLVPTGMQRDVVRAMLEQFRNMILGFADAERGIFVVPTQGTLKSDSLWANEMHPTAQGFEMVAKVFRDTLRASFPGRV